MNTYCAFDEKTKKYLMNYQADKPRPEITPFTGRRVIHVRVTNLSVLNSETDPVLVVIDGVNTVV